MGFNYSGIRSENSKVHGVTTRLPYYNRMLLACQIDPLKSTFRLLTQARVEGVAEGVTEEIEGHDS